MKQVKPRAVELDVWRGVAVFIMLFYHLIFDWYVIFGWETFAWFEADWFFQPVRVFTIPIFLIVAGISCVFARHNGKRALKMGLIAAALTIVSVIASLLFNQAFYIFWQVIHLLAFGVLSVYFLEKLIHDRLTRCVIYLVLIVFFLAFAPHLADLYNWQANAPAWLLFLGPGNDAAPGMLDYMPLIPWVGFFYLGALVGPLLYPQGKVEKPRLNQPIFKPLAFLGRHALLIYAIHQPIMLGLTSVAIKLV